ncbi:IS66 family insertion sequence element accessory protein TnpA [Sorangium sp. So ce764]|uniref:IS66 family insertion sequence element accessory protein TnpA n=1 Tax=Sorangium sp. So ce764 TaxID=3133320 RepID=UPI003F5F011B
MPGPSMPSTSRNVLVGEPVTKRASSALPTPPTVAPRALDVPPLVVPSPELAARSQRAKLPPPPRPGMPLVRGPWVSFLARRQLRPEPPGGASSSSSSPSSPPTPSSPRSSGFQAQPRLLPERLEAAYALREAPSHPGCAVQFMMACMTRTKATEVMWSERVRAWRESGETAEEFARSRGFAASTLHGWSSRLSRAEPPRFLRLVPKAPAVTSSARRADRAGSIAPILHQLTEIGADGASCSAYEAAPRATRPLDPLGALAAGTVSKANFTVGISAHSRATGPLREPSRALARAPGDGLEALSVLDARGRGRSSGSTRRTECPEPGRVGQLCRQLHLHLVVGILPAKAELAGRSMLLALGT